VGRSADHELGNRLPRLRERVRQREQQAHRPPWSELHNPSGGNNFVWHIFDDNGANTSNPGVNLLTGFSTETMCG
jgi:hypothetical protein